MFSCHAACRRAVQRSLDEIPANAFARNFKRHGSSVPGPLEAQRRLSRRRMVNMTATCGGAGYDLGALMGSEIRPESHDWKWQSPSDVKGAASPALPFWLTDTAPPFSPAPSAIDVEEATLESEPKLPETLQHRSRPQLSDDLSLLMETLSLATRVDHVQRVIADSKVHSRVSSGPEYSELIARRLIDLRAPTGVLIDFLADPAISFSGARTILKIFQYFGRQPITEPIYASIGLMLKQAIALGLASDGEIRGILLHAPSLAAQVHASLDARDTAIISLYALIWEGIQSCTVLPVQDLTAETLGLFLCQLKSIPFSIEVQRLGVSIITSASTSQLRRMRRGVSSFLANWVRGSGGSIVGSEMSRIDAIPEIARLLNGIPERLARSFVSSTTSALLVQKVIVIEPGSPCDLLYRWIGTVSQCRSISRSGVEWRAIEDMLAADRSQRRVARYLMGFGSRETCEFFLRYWVHYEMEERGGYGCRTDATLHNLQRRFRTMCNGPDDRRAYFKIVLALHQLGLPYGRVAIELFRLLKHLSRYDAMVDVAKSMRYHRLQIRTGKMSSTIRDVTKVSPSSALQLLALFPGVKPEDHRGLLCLSITSKFLHAVDIFALIKNNARWRKDHKPDADLLHHLALAFAHSPHLSPRAALRYVHWCWLGLRRFGLPLTPEISRAFAHAGITRSLQAGQWVSSPKLRWILELVSELEGKEIAEELDVAVFGWRGKLIEDRRQGIRRVPFHDKSGSDPTNDEWEDNKWESVGGIAAACHINDS
ncbi:hypothetical protein FGG08_002710 [Glutinoglossum americanum]|uniref:Uncharacterized protein n=1 Tax=Glutinoglossum americanum TaxID=1670608 RepID=A0A9P8I458_9PEZI|nr:hypothetical protein FGG08_002710 [Glutinoglossum americanum]